MTKKFYVTNVKEIKNLRIACNKCGSVITLPADKPMSRNIAKCPGCMEVIPEQIQNLVYYFQDAFKRLEDCRDDNSFALELESSPTEN